MKLVLTSDWHLDTRTAGVARAGEIKSVVWDAVEYAKTIGAHRFLFLGDLCDIEGGPEVFDHLAFVASVTAELRRSGIKPIFLNGNHDCSNGISLWRPLAELAERDPTRGEAFDAPWFLTAPRLEVVKGVGRDTAFIYLPHPTFKEEAGQGRGLNDMLRDWARKAIPVAAPVYIFSHLSIGGLPAGEESGEFRKGKDSLLDMDFLDTLAGSRRAPITVFQGHYHKAGTYRANSPVRVHVVGTPVRLSYAEVHHTPGFLHVDTEAVQPFRTLPQWQDTPPNE